MKKYLDIKTNVASSQQSNLRANLNMKPDTKPSNSTSASTSTVARNLGHTRTASSSTTASTANQIRNLTTSLSRVSRKEPTTTAPTPYIPVRSVPTSKTTPESQTEGKKPTATRPGSAQEIKAPVPPLRSQSCSTTSAAPHRIPMTSGVNPAPATSGPQSLPSSGPRRVPMPPPPPPAPAKEKPAVTLKRQRSKVDTASSSGQRPAVSAAPAKKPVVTVTSSLRNRAQMTTQMSVQSKANKLTIAASSSGNTKPLAIKSKPGWGRSAPVPKVAATTSQRATVPSSKTITKKSSSRQISATTSEASKTRPATPALIALPPSPTPEDTTDTDEIPTTQKPENELDETPPSRQSPMSAIDDEQQELQGERKASPISSETMANPTSADDGASYGELDSHPNSSDVTSMDETPTTPQGVLVNPADTDAAILAAKTPISALLSSIQRGFLYSPSSPLSPADSYLLPGPHRPNKDRDGPVQPFNFALHPPSNHTFGKGIEEMALGDIGVVKVTDHNVFTPSACMLGEGSRQAFVDFNK